ncbi:hypothetical protein ACHWQZ_G013946 [Mnemiopsis leidyi]
MRVCILLILVVELDSHFPEHCSYVTVAGGNHGNNTAAEFPARGTLCYNVILNTSTGQTKHRLYTLQHISTEVVYPVISSYNFTVPNITTTCICACPNEGPMVCESLEEDCGKDCTVVSAEGQTPEGCVWVGGEATSCCKFSVTHNSTSIRGQIVQLAAPADVRHVFTVTLLDLDEGEETIFQNISISNSGTQHIDEYLDVYIEVGGVSEELIPAGLYVQYLDKIFKMWGDQINGVEGWDLTKLGWYRGSLETGWRINLKEKVQIRTLNCGRNNGRVMVSARYFDAMGFAFNIEEHLIKLEEYYGTAIETVRLENDDVVAHVLPARLGDVRATLQNKTSIAHDVWLSDTSSLKNFTAILTRDEYGNNILTLQLEEGVGEITGYVQSGKGREKIFFTSSNQTLRLRVVTECGENTEVCLHTICRAPLCQSREFRGWHSANFHLLPTNWSTVKGRVYAGTWYSFGKPHYWFDTGFHFGELVMPAVYLVLVGVLFRFLVQTLNKPTVRVSWKNKRKQKVRCKWRTKGPW